MSEQNPIPSAVPTTIYHITESRDWHAAQATGRYVAPSLVAEGFIHCSTLVQVVPVANALYAARPDLVLLVIDPDLLSAPVVYEPPSPPSTADRPQLFPHVYGPIEVTAVTNVVGFPPNPDGTFTLPEEVTA